MKVASGSCVARYYDPRTSVWQSVDPILGKYIPNPNQRIDNLAGMGGVYNSINLAMHTYGHQNPVKMVDPDGNSSVSFEIQGNLTVFAKLLKGSKFNPFGKGGASAGITLSFPTPWDPDAEFDVGVTVSQIITGEATLSKPNSGDKKKTTDLFSINLNLLASEGSVTDLEGNSLQTTAFLLGPGVFDREDDNGNVTSYGLTVGTGDKKIMKGFGIDNEYSQTEVYSLRRGANRVGNAAMNTTAEFIGDKTKQYINDAINQILNPMPSLEQ